MIAGGIAALVIVVALASLFGFWNAPTSTADGRPRRATFAPPSGPPIRIGLAIVQSGSGAPQGKEILLAMKIWQEDVNARGGSARPAGRDRRPRRRGQSRRTCRASMRGLIDIDKVDIVVSGWPTFLIMQAMPVVMQRNKLFLGLLGLEANHGGRTIPATSRCRRPGPTLRSVLTRGLFNIAMAQNPKPRTVAITAVDEAGLQRRHRGRARAGEGGRAAGRLRRHLCEHHGRLRADRACAGGEESGPCRRLLFRRRRCRASCARSIRQGFKPQDDRRRHAEPAVRRHQGRARAAAQWLDQFRILAAGAEAAVPRRRVDAVALPEPRPR